MKFTAKSTALIIFACLLSSQIMAQGIDIFGFYQARISKDYSKMGDQTEERFQPYLQQLDIMFRKEFNESFTSYVDLQFLNSFSTEKGWGSLNVEEAWLNYEYSPLFNLRTGWIIPRFNYLNEVKNRMPALPYVMRPLIYESSLSEVFDGSGFLPERALVQLNGKLAGEDMDFNYSFFAGPAESGFITSSLDSSTGTPGTDTVNFKLFGGRLGLNYKDLRFGVSGTYDKTNLQSSINENVKRYRLGFDLGFAYKNFTLEGEFIKVFLDPKNTTEDLNKIFYYGTLQYDFFDNFFAYGTYSYMKDKGSMAIKDGMHDIILGAGYRATNDIVFKIQYMNSFSKETSNTPVMTGAPAGGGEIPGGTPPVDMPAGNGGSPKMDIKTISIATSVLF